MSLLRALRDVLTPGTPEHRKLMDRMSLRDARLTKNLLLLEDPFSRSIMAATDEAAEFGDVRKE